MRHFMPLILASFVTFGCGKTDGDAVSAGSRQPAQDGWTIHEDDYFKFEMPPKSEVFGPVNGKHDPKHPGLAVEPAESEMTLIGAVGIQLEVRFAGMLLRDAAAGDIDQMVKQGGGLLARSQVNAKNAKCLGAVLRNPPQSCPAVHFDPHHGTCYSAVYRSYCDDPSGRRWEVMMLMPSSTAKDALSPRAKQQAATYERILRSLEFKKS